VVPGEQVPASIRWTSSSVTGCGSVVHLASPVGWSSRCAGSGPAIASRSDSAGVLGMSGSSEYGGSSGSSGGGGSRKLRLYIRRYMTRNLRFPPLVYFVSCNLHFGGSGAVGGYL